MNVFVTHTNTFFNCNADKRYKKIRKHKDATKDVQFSATHSISPGDLMIEGIYKYISTSFTNKIGYKYENIPSKIDLF